MFLFMSVFCVVLSVVLNNINVVGLFPLCFLCNPSISIFVFVNNCGMFCICCSMVFSVSISVCWL